MGYQIFEFGSLYMDNVPLATQAKTIGDVLVCKEDRFFEIGSTVKHPALAIKWIKPHGLNVFVADRVLLVNMSWNALKMAGFVDGIPIMIDGFAYLARLPQVGMRYREESGFPTQFNDSEWDRCLDAAGEADDLWHWTNMSFWGSDVSEIQYAVNADYCGIRGGESARSWNGAYSTSREINIGFRPVLEPLVPAVLPNRHLINLEQHRFSIGCMTHGMAGPTFNPILYPTNPDMSFNDSVFQDIPSGTQVRMYTLLSDGKPVEMDSGNLPSHIKGSELTFTDKFYGEQYLISWTISNGAAYASRPLLKISQDELIKQFC